MPLVRGNASERENEARQPEQLSELRKERSENETETETYNKVSLREGEGSGIVLRVVWWRVSSEVYVDERGCGGKGEGTRPRGKGERGAGEEGEEKAAAGSERGPR